MTLGTSYCWASGYGIIERWNMLKRVLEYAIFCMVICALNIVIFKGSVSYATNESERDSDALPANMHVYFYMGSEAHKLDDYKDESGNHISPKYMFGSYKLGQGVPIKIRVRRKIRAEYNTFMVRVSNAAYPGKYVCIDLTEVVTNRYENNAPELLYIDDDNSGTGDGNDTIVVTNEEMLGFELFGKKNNEASFEYITSYSVLVDKAEAYLGSQSEYSRYSSHGNIRSSEVNNELCYQLSQWASGLFIINYRKELDCKPEHYRMDTDDQAGGVDTADFVYWNGHGATHTLTFYNTHGIVPVFDDSVKWGNLDLDWIALGGQC